VISAGLRLETVSLAGAAVAAAGLVIVFLSGLTKPLVQPAE
jgi:hypothetical protein